MELFFQHVFVCLFVCLNDDKNCVLSCQELLPAGEEAFIAKWAKTTQGRHRNVCFDVHCYHCCLALKVAS